MMTLIFLAALSAYEPVYEQSRGGGTRPPTPYRPPADIPGNSGSGDFLDWLMPRFMSSLLVGCWVGFVAGMLAIYGFKATDEGATMSFVFIGIPAAVACGLILGFSEGNPAPVDWVYNHGFLSIGLFLVSLVGGFIYVESKGRQNKKGAQP